MRTFNHGWMAHLPFNTTKSFVKPCYVPVAKMHGIPEQDKFELFWLDRSVSLADALKAATESTVWGLAEKGQQGLLALRFQNHGDFCQICQSHPV